MGQPFNIYNITTNETYQQHAFHQWLSKFSELASSNGVKTALTVALHGPWNGHRVALIGSDARDSDIPSDTLPCGASLLYEAMQDYPGKEAPEIGTKDITSSLRSRMTRAGITTGKKDNNGISVFADPSEAKVDDTTPLSFYNPDKNQKLTPALLGVQNSTLKGIIADTHGGIGGVVEALMALIKTPNRGGGDMNIKDDAPYAGRIGSWLGDRIQFIPISDIPNDAEDVTLDLRKAFIDSNYKAQYIKNSQGDVIRLGAWGVTELTYSEMQDVKARIEGSTNAEAPLPDCASVALLGDNEEALLNHSLSFRANLRSSDVQQAAKIIFDALVENGFGNWVQIPALEDERVRIDGETWAKDFYNIEVYLMAASTYLDQVEPLIPGLGERLVSLNEGMRVPDADSMAKMREGVRERAAAVLFVAAQAVVNKAVWDVLRVDNGRDFKFLDDVLRVAPAGFERLPQLFPFSFFE